uniref:Peptidylglycine alpha-amidating monooxygenase n=1 Tax=Meleagris gallopavo TaxID=9103 RepID=A0A803Y2Y1_MELGA
MAGLINNLLILILVLQSICLGFRSSLSVFKRYKDATRSLSSECFGSTRPVISFGLSDFALDIRMPGVTPKQSDTYLCMSVPLPVDDEAYVVDFKPHASMDTVHHMLLFGCNEPSSNENYWDCDEGICKDKSNILYAWARNAPPTRLPKGVGFRVGGETGSKFFVLQVHYGDISAFRGIIWVLNYRQPLIAGMYLMMSVNTVIPPGEKVVDADIACHYKRFPMHLFAYRVHTHRLGKVVSGYRVRNGQWTLIGRQSPQVPQAFYPVEHPVDVSYDDILAARCVFSGEGRTTETHIGGTANDEMCNFYIMYYMEAKHAVSYTTCTQNANPEMFRNIPEEANIPIPVKPDMLKMAHGHHEETKDTDKSSLQLSKGEEEEILDQNFHIEEAMEWPGLDLKLGQVSGLALDPENNVVIFHRGGPYKKNTLMIALAISAAEVSCRGKITVHFVNKSIMIMIYLWLLLVALNGPIKATVTAVQGSSALIGYGLSEVVVVLFATCVLLHYVKYYFETELTVSVCIPQQMLWIFCFAETSSGKAGPGQFRIPHSLALIPELSQLCVADRENGRIQCFRLETGEFVREIKHKSFGRELFAVSYSPGGLLFAVNGMPYPGESEPVQGFVMNFSTGEIIDSFIPLRKSFEMPHDIVASEDKTVFVGDVHARTVWKFASTEKMEHRSVKKAGIEVQEIKASETVVEARLKNNPESTDPLKKQEKQHLVQQASTGVSFVLITTLLIIPVVVLLAILVFIHWRKTAVYGGKGGGGLNLGNFFASHKGYSRKGFDRVSTEGSDQEKDEDDGTDSEEEYSAPAPPQALSSS